MRRSCHPRLPVNINLGYAQSLEKLDIKGFIARKDTLNNDRNELTLGTPGYTSRQVNLVQLHHNKNTSCLLETVGFLAREVGSCVMLIKSSLKALTYDRSSTLHIMLPAHPPAMGFCLSSSILLGLEYSSRLHVGLTVAAPCLCGYSIHLLHRASNLWKQLGQDQVIPSREEAAQHYSRREQDLESQGHIRRKGDRINLRGGIYGDRPAVRVPTKAMS